VSTVVTTGSLVLIYLLTPAVALLLNLYGDGRTDYAIWLLHHSQGAAQVVVKWAVLGEWCIIITQRHINVLRRTHSINLKDIEVIEHPLLMPLQAYTSLHL